MRPAIKSICLAAILIIGIFVPSCTSMGEETLPFWDERWSFRQEINIPIDTSIEYARYQPIDMYFEFNNTCWAKNKEQHSIRICVYEGYMWYELESQIYNLEYVDDEHIKGCNIVFIIPEFADGNEKYFIYYNDEKTPSPKYEDHVSVKEEYYSITPFKGCQMESYYYQISDEGNIIYAVVFDGCSGEFENVCNQVIKMKPNTKTVKPDTSEITSGFYFAYYYQVKNSEGKWTWAEEQIVTTNLVSKEILVDGNLMVKFKIVSKSEHDEVETTVVYTYYYSPVENKRINAHVKHEVKSENYDLFPKTPDIDVSYASIDLVVSKNIYYNELNFGKIYPSLYVYEEKEHVIPFKINTHPSKDDGVVDIIKTDDIDLGSQSWISLLDESENGRAHGLIFNTTNIVTSGENERQGIELQHYEISDTIYTGFDFALSKFYLGRNAFEKGDAKITEMSDDLTVEFNAEFFTTESGGYKSVEREAEIYKTLLFHQKNNTNENKDHIDEEKETYDLKVIYDHPGIDAWSSIFGENGFFDFFIGSRTIYVDENKPIQKILKFLGMGEESVIFYAEIYKDNILISSGECTPLPPGFPTDKWGKRMLTELGYAWSVIKNLIEGKKTVFTNLEPGKYVVKMFMREKYKDDEISFINLAIVDITESTDVTISWGSVRRNYLYAKDSQNENVEDVEFLILKDDVIVQNGFTDPTGFVELRVPFCDKNNESDHYIFKVMYDGFSLYESYERWLFKGPYLNKILDTTNHDINVTLDLSDLTIKFQDSEGNTPEYNVDLMLTSDEMTNPVYIHPDEIVDNECRFFDLLNAEYKIKVKYRSFETEETVNVPEVDYKVISLYNQEVEVNDDLGFPIDAKLDVVLSSDDFEKQVVIVGEEIEPGKYLFNNLYRGDYVLKVSYKSFYEEKFVRIPRTVNEPLKVNFPAMYDVTLFFIDSRGNTINDQKCSIIKNETEIYTRYLENEKTTISLPPGTYICKTLSQDDSIYSEQKIDVSCSAEYSIVSPKEPTVPLLVLILGLIILIFAGFYFTFKKDAVSFLKIFAVVFAVVAIVMPWWMTQGYSADNAYESTTNLYLYPTNFVNIIKGPNVAAGEVLFMPDLFATAMGYIQILIVLSCIFIVLNLISNKFNRKKISLISLLIGGIILTSALGVFLYAIGEYVSTGAGSIIGSGEIQSAIPGECGYETFASIWGPSNGFILCLISLVVLIGVIVYSIKQFYSKEKVI